MTIIETDRLKIRRFSCNDWKDLHEYLSEEQVVRYEPYGIYTEEDCINEAVKRSLNEAFWAVCLKDSNKLIGNVYFDQQHPKDFSNWEIGYVFNPQYYGNGYATESCKAVMDYGFKKLKVRRIVAMCNPDNIASWKLLERLKMRREGYLRKNIFFKKDEKGDPIWNDTYEYAILVDEWLRLLNNYFIREINSNELHLLEDFLYEAIYQPDENNLLSRDIIKEPKINVYIDDWGKKDDLCLVAVEQNKIIGAVWTRILSEEVKGYGNIDDETPEFAISILKEHRKQGIGTELMKNMIELLKEKGYHKTSLSVAKKNYACKMYKDLGFKIIDENQDDYLMILQLK